MQQFIRHLATNTLRGLHLSPVIGQVLSGFLESPQRDRLLNDAMTLVSESVEAIEVSCPVSSPKNCPWSGCSIPSAR
jgi:hypothetical protein